MQSTDHENWIGGAWTSPASRAFFETGVRSVERAPDRWPRSSEAEVDAALTVLLRAGREWSERRQGARRELVLEALEELQADAAADRLLGASLGLGGRECGAARRAAARAARGAVRAAYPGPTEPGVALVRADACTDYAGLLELLCPPLLAGLPTLLCSDSRLPCLADAVTRALVAVDLPAGGLALVHGDNGDVLRSALARHEVRAVYCSGSEPELEGVRRRVRGRTGKPPAVLTTGSRAPFGAGVVELGEPRLVLETGRDRCRVVRRGEDPAAAAAKLLRDAFDPADTWSGQRAGRVGRVLCHQSSFSLLTEAVLEGLDRLERESEGVRPLDAEVGARVEHHCRLGLDEGATLIREGSGLLTKSRVRSGGAVRGVPVLTNVEPRMRVARPSRPAPLLVLMRSADDEAALAQAAELDAARS